MVFLFSYLLKWSLVRKSSIDFDTCGHLYFINELRKQGRSPWQNIKIQCWDGRYLSHPFFLHSILSFIQTKVLFKKQKFINVFLDSLFSVFILIAATAIFDDLKLAFSCVLIYLFTPIWFSKISMGPRIGNFTPRLFTELIFNILLCILFGLYNISTVEFYIITILLTSIILLTSKFGLQVVLFVLPLASLVLKNLYPFYLIAFSFLFTIIISRGKVLNLFFDQFKHLKNYYKANSKNNTAISNRNKVVFFSLKELMTFNGIRKFVYNYLFYNSYTVIFFKMPVLIFLLLGLAKYQFIIFGFFYYINIFIISVVILFCIISMRKFLFLGEAERYLNHIAIIILFSFINLIKISDSYWVIYLLIIYGIIYYLIEIFFYDKFLNVKNQKNADLEIENILNLLPIPKIVLCYPYHNFNIYRLMLNTIHKPIIPSLMNTTNIEIFMSNYDIKNTYLDLEKIDEIIGITDCSIIIIYNYSILEKHLGYKEILFNAGWKEKKLYYQTYNFFCKE